MVMYAEAILDAGRGGRVEQCLAANLLAEFCYIRSTMAAANSEQRTSFAPRMRRARS